MEKKINIVFSEEKLFSEISAMIKETREEKTKKQSNILCFFSYFFAAMLYGVPYFFEKSEENLYFVFLPLIFFSIFFTILFIISRSFSEKRVKRIRRDFVDNFEISISRSKWLFVKISLDDYEKSLTYKIEKKIEELDSEIFLTEEEVKKVQKKISLLLDDEESSEILGDKIASNKDKIFYLRQEKEKYEEIIEQIIS